MAKRILICAIFFFGIFLLIGFSQAQCSLGKWGGSCQYNCSESCYEGNECTSNGGNCGCDQIAGHCFGCPKDFHGDFCTKECGANCSLSDPCLQSGIACGCHQQYGTCNSCPKTSWGDYCERTCSDKCITSECGRSFGNCTSGCIKGFYGANCNRGCSSACQYGCDQETAACFPLFCVNCKGGMPNCDTNSKKCKAGCIDGFLGDSCDKSCEEITNTTLCTKCEKLESVGITVCLECQSGYYTDAMTKQCKLCSTSCKVNSTTVARCFPDTGNCRFGCTPGWSGSRCDTFNCAVGNCNTCVVNQPTVCATCQIGWYLDGGQCIKCSDNCANTNQCDKVSGSCNNGCKTGWYGTKCLDSCTTNCIQGECDDSGICTQGCNGKRYGQKCDSLCSNCLTTCNRNSGVCDSTCVNGYYGSDCSLLCPSNCLNNQCNQGDGKCSTGCKSGYYGNACLMQCGSNCDGNVCDFVTGACSGTCASGKYGSYCDLDCLIHCSPKICQKNGGACSSLCEKGYYGSHCNIPCPSSCSTNECSKSDGTCTGNCPSGKYGTRCELTCSSNCNGTSCGQTSGTCSDGCIAGYYGNTCHEPCTRCDSLGCQQSTGECIGTTIKDDTEVDLAIIIGASVGGFVALLIIIIIICCHCLRTRNRSKGGSADILTPRSDSLVGIDNHQFDNFHEIKKDDWVMRNTTLHYEHPKQNGVLLTIGEADAQMDYYDFPPPPTHAEDYDSDQGTIPSANMTMPPPPLEIHFADFDGRDGIQVEMFPQYVEYMMQKENAFENEYRGLPYGLKHPYDVGLKVGNKRKNRYKNIYAYDHSRVVLVPEIDTSDDDNSSVVKNENSDYINASYFDGYHNRRAYISCQGPTDEMIDDFWRMIWQHRIQTVVMLTNLVESGEIKCKKYWPDENKIEKFGNIYVKFDYQEVFADFILTNLVVTKSILHDNARLQVKHLQFTSWPDKDVPKYVTPLVEFYCKVTSMHRDGPLLVHCSAGVGRSGTFIGLDFLMDQADSEGRVNIYKCVDNMRIARVNMVQTPDQYVFLHQALSEALQTSESPVDEDEFENYYNQMLIKDPRSGLSKLQHEFSQLKAQKVNNVFEAATMEENVHRNRRQDILASDECRVFLWSKIKGCTDYINAIYLPSFRNKYCFIATEMPQCSTIVDFCRMIFQEEVRTIVMLDNESSGINVNEHYWPNPKQTMECGPFSIKLTEEEEHEDYMVRSMNFKFAVDDQNGTYKVNQFHYKCWSEGKVTPSSVDSFLNFVRAVTAWQSDSVKHPIIVHCLDGATKLGLFCLVRACLDRLEADGDVSVVHTLHHIRARRHQIVPNYEQYKFCHDCILKQITTLDL